MITKTAAERSLEWRQQKTVCLVCGQTRPRKAKGICSTCYNREWRKSEKAREILKISNARRNKGRALWGSKVWHELSNMPCKVCGWEEASRDIHHIIPRSKGGTNDRENLITLCPNHHRMVEQGFLDLTNYK